MEYCIRILRTDPRREEPSRFQPYVYRPPGQRSLLEALIDIRDEQQPDLAFRYACREAICGSCAMVVNGEFALACRTDLEQLGSTDIVVEPLPHLEVRKDLIVDMEPFWEALRRVQAWLHAEGPAPDEGHRVEERRADRIVQFVGCILCGSCYAACPTARRDDRYLGPAALARLWRFIDDPRDQRPLPLGTFLDSEEGVWGCDTVYLCNQACPKGVRPADGILALRRRMLVERVKRLLGIGAKR